MRAGLHPVRFFPTTEDKSFASAAVLETAQRPARSRCGGRKHGENAGRRTPPRTVSLDHILSNERRERKKKICEILFPIGILFTGQSRPEPESRQAFRQNTLLGQPLPILLVLPTGGMDKKQPPESHQVQEPADVIGSTTAG